MEPGLEPADRAKIDGQEIEEQRAFGLGGERDHLAARIGRHLAVDVLEVRRLSPEPGAVVDELTIDLAGRVVDHRHGRVNRKSTRLNSSHLGISYAVFCL